MRPLLVSTVLTASLLATAACGARKQHQTLQREGEALRQELVELYVARGAREAAAALLRRSLADDPRDARARVLYGTVLRDLGLYPQAEAELRAALALDAGRPDALAALAILLDLTGRHDAALAHHRAAAARVPGNAAYRNNLGFSLLAAGDAAAAIPPLEQALALDPSLPHAYANLGFAYGRAGRLDEAGRTFRAGLGEAAALLNLALIHDERGEADEAAALRERAFALDPDLRPTEEPTP